MTRSPRGRGLTTEGALPAGRVGVIGPPATVALLVVEPRLCTARPRSFDTPETGAAA
eukprot:CAMPEP_0183571442 /NCGR_PEP_ID=MMETSP0371-20130417/126081_1 /TAXON_ID=268820 /ORGANISM="Peridinium aciculiferum, Strain PAER-2" /LENGTH=56 /DNA_ID=CAMNT_0025781215 /DNA_START=62 /DNA_END=229 /DNA_ORIENTATION=-